VNFHYRYPLEGYRRLAFMMIDQDVVAVSPATVYRVLKKAGRLDRWNRSPAKKGTGFVQALNPVLFQSSIVAEDAESRQISRKINDG